ncbi:hypothetical protein GCM10010495_22590 [Kitasatospora herbaricolor]|nr:hypothetical protein [Kitasatospora herbaricolor]MDQ0308954.1 hypothetical protein [Kitasatospora herbaricolor]GGV09224.1 hypothetical protein GCM10010495_22590 [Kitasatospora herbaricolor]
MSAPVTLPWATVGGVVAAAAVITVPCAALSAAWALRGRPVVAVAR